MGELSFRYDIKNQHKLVHSFRYWLSQVIEYGFAYQRFVALYDTRIFNSPVVITKVATGLPFICGPFVRSRRSFDMESLNGLHILKAQKHTAYMAPGSQYFIEKDKKSFIPSQTTLFVANIHLKYDATIECGMVSGYANNSRVPLNIYRNFLAKPADIVANRLQNPLGKRPDYVLSELDVLLCKHTTLIVPALINTDVHGRAHTNIANVYENISGSTPGISTVYDPHIMSDRINDDKLQYSTATLFGRPKQKQSHKNELILSYRAVFRSNVAQDYHGATTSVPFLRTLDEGKHLLRGDIYASVNASRQAHRLTSNPSVYDVQGACKQDPYGHYDTYDMHGESTQNQGIYEYYTRMGHTALKNVVAHYDIAALRQSLLGSCMPTMLSASTSRKNAQTALGVMAMREAGFGRCVKPGISMWRSGARAYTARGEWQSKTSSSSDVANKPQSLGKLSSGGRTTDQQWMYHTIRDADLYHGGSSLYRKSALLGQYDSVFLSKSASGMFTTYGHMTHKTSSQLYITEGFGVKKASRRMSRQDLYVHMHRERYGLSVSDQTSVYRQRYDLSMAQQSAYIDKRHRDLVVPMLDVGVHRNNNGVFSTDTVSLYRIPKDLEQYRYAISLLKDVISVQNTGALANVIKSMWHIRMPRLGGSHDGLIVPVTKSYTDVSTFNDEVGKMAYKLNKDVFVTENAMASILRKPAFLSGLNVLGAEKMYRDVMMDVYNYFAEKAVIKAAVQKGVDIYRMPYDAFITQTVGHSFKDNTPSPPGPEPDPDDPFPDDPPQNFGIMLSQHVWAVKKEHDTVIYDPLLLDVHKMQLNAQVYKDEFANKDRYGLYYFYDTFAEQTKDAMSMLGSLQATLEGKDVGLYSVVPASSLKHDATLYDSVVYGAAAPNNAEVIQQLKAFERSRKEIEEFLSDFGNWVWVYETPSPFDSKTYGIDELLLPEEDPRYEYFEDIIFDKETMTPRDPIKILGPTSFLARYPIEMPIEEFADVGNIYEDSAEKWDQYFGIETDVMRDIYLKYYQIWQAKIFEFSTMTMVQSTKKMLEYLYTWIDMYYPVDKMQQALRVFRQIRWFSESAIIRNSQYIISYEYDTLKSNLHTGTCHVPNDLDTVTNPTMYVDKPNAVIRNDKAFLGQDAHVTFEIDAPKNTYIKFDLFTEYGKGTAFIYLNGVLVRACTSASLGIIIQIPYTGTTNRVTIVKQGSNNIGEFYIGNISIPNASFRDLSIEFDPALRAGNKPLEEVAQKMIACANLFANKNEMYAVIKRSNLGFTETYRQMNDYWKLHHQDKTKGKRLTIKQA